MKRGIRGFNIGFLRVRLNIGVNLKREVRAHQTLQIFLCLKHAAGADDLFCPE